MDRNDVNWSGYWPACPTPFRADESYDPDSHRALLEWYIGQGVHGPLVNGTTGEWFSQTTEERMQVAETAIDAAAGRVPVVIGCTAYTAREAGALAKHALAAGADGVESTPPPYGKPFDHETVAVLPGSRGRDRRADDGLQLAARHGRRHRRPTSPAARRDRDRSSRSRTRRRTSQQFCETSRRVVDRLRVFGPFMSTAGLEQLKAHGGDGFIGGGTLFGAARREVLGGLVGRRRGGLPGARRAAPRSCSRSSGCPAAGPGSTAATRASSRR